MKAFRGRVGFLVYRHFGRYSTRSFSSVTRSCGNFRVACPYRGVYSLNGRRFMHAAPQQACYISIKDLSDESKDVGEVVSGEVESKETDEVAQAGGETPEKASSEESLKQILSDSGDAALLPKEIVKELDRFIIGQQDAKRAVAVALRNRWRRRQLAPEQAAEIIPKNILMIGPTGVGKTEIARRLAKLSQAPFIKVEATKFTEVGFHGRDVDSIIRDLVEIAIHEVTAMEKKRVKESVREEVEEKLLELLVGRTGEREAFRNLLRKGKLEKRTVEMHVPPPKRSFSVNAGENAQNQEFLSKILENLEAQGQQMSKARMKKLTIEECRPLIEDGCIDQKLSKETITKLALQSVENNGIVFLDEIDKICIKNGAYRSGVDASSEGVQRDLLPLIEGTTITTKHGNVDTSKVLFIASGAFHDCKPSDLLAELQGRLPIRVQLKPLDKNDIYRILTETHFNQIDQAEALMKTEGIDLKFEDNAIRTISELTHQVNETVENIGARRLHTVLERILEEVSYEVPVGTEYRVTAALVKEHVSDMLLKSDLSKYVL
eukprot:TRINITY_DN5168_c0_g1_i1.p1 TRINITY_DN5168_c0_g1~~TRINITY_DN5168_c0_g1_i1.p1  ORF type:complete len:549 (-),score=89.99 TRINITY_DN5168_c0_g1_i1:46-1692(-)